MCDCFCNLAVSSVGSIAHNARKEVTICSGEEKRKQSSLTSGAGQGGPESWGSLAPYLPQSKNFLTLLLSQQHHCNEDL